MTSKEFTKAVASLDTVNYNKIDKSFAILREDVNTDDISPKEITLNSIIKVSQETSDGEFKSFLFNTP